MSRRIAVIKWNDCDEIAEALGSGIDAAGHDPILFRADQVLPHGCDAVLTFAPYGRLQQVGRQLAAMLPCERPAWVHWNTENPPMLDIPWTCLRPICAARSWMDRLCDAESPWVHSITASKPFATANRRAARLRYTGDYHHAFRAGLLHTLIESSEIYTQWNRAHGLPAQFVPWGTLPASYAELNLPRSIDVLWMGQRRTERRSDVIEYIRREVTRKGYCMHVADGCEHPFVWGMERTRLLNQSRIVINIRAHALYDNIFPYRFHIAAANRALVVSEPELAHNRVYVPGKHYVVAEMPSLVDALLYHLSDERTYTQIVNNAYCLVTEEMTFCRSVMCVVAEIERIVSALAR